MRTPKLRVLYITFFISMIAVMFTYLYTDTRLDVLKSYGEDRYYILPTLFASILLTSILNAIFLKDKKRLLIVTGIIVVLFVRYNVSNIWWHIDNIQYQSDMNKAFIRHIKTEEERYDNETVIVAPSYLAWPLPMLIRFSDKNITRGVASENWESNFLPNKQNVFVYDYDFSQARNDSASKIIDLTEKFRNGGKITFQK
jgi:hypothetical protein